MASSSGLRQAISVRVARTAMDSAKMQGESMVSLIDSTAVPRAQISAAPTPSETGQTLDLVA